MFDLVIDVGAYKTSICKPKLGVVLEEPTLIATADMKSVAGVGLVAKKLLSSSSNYQPIHLINKGIIVNRQILSEMLAVFFQKIIQKKLFKKHALIFCTPTCLTAEEKTELQNLAYSLNVSKVKLLPAAVLAYVEACYNTPVHTKIILDIGADSTEVSLIYDTKVLTGYTIGLGGGNLDEAIKAMVLKKHNLSITTLQAQEIKHEIATLLPNDFVSSIVEGENIFTGKKQTVEILSQDFRLLFEEFFQEIAQSLITFKKALAPDIIDELKLGGIFICGGSANITGVERFFSSLLQLPVVVPSFPESAVMRGAEIVLNSSKILEKVISNTL